MLGLEVYQEESQSILSENQSPDLSFRFSLNAYRGCAHGCAYCYARPSHEFWGFGSGADFERRLIVKPNAAALLREALSRKSWSGDLIVISGNTDAYQPLEASYELTRQCLLVCLEFNNPVHIITKSALIERDIELLEELHEAASVGVSVSVTFWDREVSRALEPYAPTAQRRVETIARLSAAGLPVMVHAAPVIPGLSDRDLIPILEAAREAGAISAMTMPVRLPGSVKQVFEERLREALPLRADRVLARIREMRGGKLDESRFGDRQRGLGNYAAAIDAVFRATTARLGYRDFPAPRTDRFRRPSPRRGQLSLF